MAQNIGQTISKTSDENTILTGISNINVTATKTLPPSSSSSSSGGAGTGGKKKIRRAFSMPRNPFRLSRRFKTGTSSSGKELPDNNQSKDQVTNVDGAPHNTTTPTTMNETEVAAGRMYESSTAPTTNNNINNITNNNKNRLFRRTSWKKFLSRIAQQMTSINIGAKQTVATDRVPPLGGYQWPPDQIPGVTGLKNHGNTCFMNAVLQCLSHTDILAEYFVLDQYKADLKRRNKLTSRKFGTKGELTEQLALVLKALWTCKIESDYSTSFKAVVDRYGTQFRSSTQHDAQEFLFWLLDKVHEDLNTASKRKYKSIKNSYGRSDEAIAAETLANHIRCNNSFVQAVFQAQFRSSLSCPRCHKQSNTFDPFHCISVQLPQLAQQAVFVTVLYATQHPRQVKLGLGVPPGSPIVALREQLQADTGIPLERIILTEITEIGFGRVFCDSHPMSSLCENDPIYCIETASNITADETSTTITLIIANVQRSADSGNEKMPVKRFGTPFCVKVCRDVSYTELQKKLLKEMQSVLKSDVFAYATPLTDMFRIRLQDPSADPDTYIEPTVEHPLYTEMIDLALSVLPTDVGPTHIKLLLEWMQPEKYFIDQTDPFVEHESVSQFGEKFQRNPILTLEQCLEHYTKAETLSTEDAWRCPNCQKYLPVVKTLGLWSLPDILVIHFKRFRQQHIKGPQAAKLTTTVKFPLNNFDMTPHLARGSNVNITGMNSAGGNNVGGGGEDNWSPWRKMRRRENNLMTNGGMLKENRYDLYSVCYHQGDTLETGHYTAACKNPYDHQWYKFDDQRVSQVPADRVPEDIVNNEAYMLFYQRRKFDNMECSGTSSTSGDHWVSKIAVAPSHSSGVSTSNTLPATTHKTATPAMAKSIKTRQSSIETLNNADEAKNESTIDVIQNEMLVVEENTQIDKSPIASSSSKSSNHQPTTANKINLSKINSVDISQQIKVNVEINSIIGIPASKSLTSPIKVPALYVAIPKSPEIVVKIRKTSENEIVDIESVVTVAAATVDDTEQTNKINKTSTIPLVNNDTIVSEIINEQNYSKNNDAKVSVNVDSGNNIICCDVNDEEKIEIRQKSMQKKKTCETLLSASVPTQRSLWPLASTPPPIQRQRGSLNFSEMLTNANFRAADSIGIRHSIAAASSAAALRNRDNTSETIAMIRGASSCSKDTLMYIDQPSGGGHCLLDEDRHSHYGNKSLWISPVTPHKFITVSPKN